MSIVILPRRKERRRTLVVGRDRAAGSIILPGDPGSGAQPPSSSAPPGGSPGVGGPPGLGGKLPPGFGGAPPGRGRGRTRDDSGSGGGGAAPAVGLWTDFTGYTLNEQPSDWENRGEPGHTIEVRDDGGPYLYSLGSGNARRSAVWSVTETDGAIDVLAKVRASSIGTSGGTGPGAALLASGGADEYNAMIVYLVTGTNNLDYSRYVNGSFEAIASTTAKPTVSTGQYFWVRARYADGRVKARHWLPDAVEPSAWTIDEAEATVWPTGRSGLHRPFTGTSVARMDAFAYALNGDSAAMPNPVTSGPGIIRNGTSPSTTSTDAMRGYAFEVGNKPITVTALRSWRRGAYADRVFLWRLSDEALLASVDITSATDAWVEGSITPVTLDANTQYVVSARSQAGDQSAAFQNNMTGWEFNGPITFLHRRGGDSTNDFPTGTFDNRMSGYADIVFTL